MIQLISSMEYPVENCIMDIDNDIDERDVRQLYLENDATVLHIAAKYNDRELVEELLKRGCDVNAQDSLGRTPLMMAVRENHRDIMLTLLKAGANIFLQNHRNESALHEFFAEWNMPLPCSYLFINQLRKQCRSSKKMAKIMMDAGCQFYQAACSRNVKVLQFFLDQGFQINSRHPSTKATALHVVVGSEHLKSVQFLLNHDGVDIEALDIENRNCLSYLCKYATTPSTNTAQILAILLNRGVSPISCDSDGFFQIQATLLKGNFEVINVLLQSYYRYGINFNTRDNKNKGNLLFYLAKNLNPGVIDALKLHADKLDLNACDTWGWRPIHDSVSWHNPGLLEFLLERGVEVNCVDDLDNITPLFVVCLNKDHNFVHVERDNQSIELLLQHNADPQFICKLDNVRQITIIEVVLKRKSVDRIKYVLAHLATLEKLGVPIANRISSDINSNTETSKYFSKCRWMLQQNITKSVTVFDLFTANQDQLTKYLIDRRVVLKLKRLSLKNKLKLSFPYYWSVLSKRILKALKYRRLKKKASGIVGKVLEQFIRGADLVVDKTIEYLNIEDLQHICQQPCRYDKNIACNSNKRLLEDFKTVQRQWYPNI